MRSPKALLPVDGAPIKTNRSALTPPTCAFTVRTFRSTIELAPASTVRLALAALISLSLVACSSAPAINNTSRDLNSLATPSKTFSRPHAYAAQEQFRSVAAQASIASNSVSEGYRIGPQDVLQVSVFKVPELSKAVAVAEGGTINYPLIGETPAAGRTARDLELSLAKSLGAKYLQSPQVSVTITKYNSQRVTIEGAVKRPGIYPLFGPMSLLQLLATAEGLTEASNEHVIIYRHVNGQRKSARFSIPDIRMGHTADPDVMAGDVVVANASASKKLFNGILKAMPAAGLFALL